MASGTAVGTPTGQGHGAMQVDPVSGAVLGGRLEQVYVYEAPVRIWHWVMMIAIFILIPTGYLIGSPWSGPRGDAALSYFFGNVRVIHFCAGMIFAVAFAVRVYWAIVGNHHARAIFIPPVWSGRWWNGMFSQAKYYLFIKRESALWIGHNPLAQFAMFAMYVLGSVVIIVTGLALYAEQWGWGSSWMQFFGWVFVLFGEPQMVRTVHHLAMWYLMIFAIVHMYMVFREDIMSKQSVVGTMISGVRTFKADARIEKV